MKDIIGLAVLTSPLFLVVPWLMVAVFVAMKAAQVPKFRATKLTAGAATLVVVFLLPFSDDIAGRIYLKHLCSTEAGVKVYQTEVLPAEYWDAQGRPRFLAANGFVDLKLLPNRFEWRNKDEPYVNTIINIEKSRWQLIDTETKNILGERITYMRHFGWLNIFSPAPNIGEGCELSRQKEQEQEQSFFLSIFKSSTPNR